MSGTADRSDTEHGFSLIELVVAMSIVAILATIALPSYSTYTLRAKRTIAKTTLSQIAQQEESYFGDHKSYTSLSTLGYTAPVYVGSDANITSSANSSTIYQITAGPRTGATMSSCTTTGSPSVDYLVIATPVGAQLSGDTQCATLCLASTAERGATGTSGASTCWQK